MQLCCGSACSQTTAAQQCWQLCRGLLSTRMVAPAASQRPMGQLSRSCSGPGLALYVLGLAEAATLTGQGVKSRCDGTTCWYCRRCCWEPLLSREGMPLWTCPTWLCTAQAHPWETPLRSAPWPLPLHHAALLAWPWGLSR